MSDMNSTPAAQWREKGEADPHGTQYECERAKLLLGDLTDDELANGAFMNYDRRQSLEEMMNPKPGQHMPIIWMTAVKERIRWLSRALVKAQNTTPLPASTNRLTDEQREAIEWAAGHAYSYAKPLDGESLMQKRWRVLSAIIAATEAK
jgi:hypothetical protein